MSEKKYKPELKVYKFDETEYWNLDVLKKYKGSKVIGFYLVDESVLTHLCEFEGSKYGYFIKNMIVPSNSLSEDEKERAYEEFENSGAEYEGEDFYFKGDVQDIEVVKLDEDKILELKDGFKKEDNSEYEQIMKDLANEYARDC